MAKSMATIYETSLRLTNTVREKMRGFGIGEETLYAGDRPFTALIERYPTEEGEPLSVALLFDVAETARLTKKDVSGSLILHGVFTDEQLLATNMTQRKSGQVRTNWQQEGAFLFSRGRRTAAREFLKMVERMTPAKERSDYVKKRITGWEGYLKIQERGMDIPDMRSSYSKLAFNHDFSRITVSGCQLKNEEWKQLRGLSVKLDGIDGDVGTVLKAQAKTRTVEVELQPYAIEQLRKKAANLQSRHIVFSNFAALSQIRRLRRGFQDLEKGLAVNPDLDRILFEEKPPVKPVKASEKLHFQNRLNEFQQQAVSGAIAAEDLYVIQGPPGTGKTTVISEICLQNAKKGLKTLVASQSNLAVDNALGRLLANKDVRILRVGRTESIEEDGKRFIEENVGQYWKDHTLKEVSEQYEARKGRSAQVAIDLEETEQAYERLLPVHEQWKLAVEEKKQAQQQNEEILRALEDLRTTVEVDSVKKQETETNKQKLVLQIEELERKAVEYESILSSGKGVAEFEAEEQHIRERITELERMIAAKALLVQIDAQQRQVVEFRNGFNRASSTDGQREQLFSALSAIRKMDELERFMAEHRIEDGISVTYLVNKMETSRERVIEWKKLSKFNEQLAAAITYVEVRAGLQPSQLEEAKRRAAQGTESFTSAEIEEFLETLRGVLKGPQRGDARILQTALGELYKRQQSLWRRGAKIETPEYYAAEAKKIFQKLKEAVEEQLTERMQKDAALVEKWKADMTAAEQALSSLEQKYRYLTDGMTQVPDPESAVREQQDTLTNLEKERQLHGEARELLEENQVEQNAKTAQLAEVDVLLTEQNGTIEQAQEKIATCKGEAASLEAILASQPEAEFEAATKQLASLSFDRESLRREQKNLPLLQSVQKKWLELLKEADSHDLDEIRKLYIRHANVIGTTCVASARKDFADNYPSFDVVIIDEVSKATPPELLLPMLKGKKIILVGDHHQLPPLLGNDTLEETLEEMINEDSTFEGKKELEQLLAESLFERLYKNLPASNKTMLAIQYRMHADIMETIAPFYAKEQDRLQCGIADSDAERDHGLESSTVNRGNHLMWIDLPNEPSFFEERMSGGKSLFNASELHEIRMLLVELNEAAAAAKEAGRMAFDSKKSIGVISFYGEQVKRIQRMIDQELRLPHLLLRTGTVDRFQGSEMDVILLSMVRNNRNEYGDIGFAKDYRRLNVALSRAKELLVLIGSTEMFTTRAKQPAVRKMYDHVLDVVRTKNGLKEVQGAER